MLGRCPIWCGWPASCLQPRKCTTQQLLCALWPRASLEVGSRKFLGLRPSSLPVWQLPGCSMTCMWGVDQP